MMGMGNNFMCQSSEFHYLFKNRKSRHEKNVMNIILQIIHNPIVTEAIV